MLKSDAPPANLLKKKLELLSYMPEVLRYSILGENNIFYFKYPINGYPQKINSITLRKKAQLDGVLMGIKGQYLIFNNNTLFNVRNHEGFVVNLRIE